MKVIYALLIILLESLYKAQNCTSAKPNKASDCTNLKADNGEFRCCYRVEKYIYMDNYIDEKSCTSLSKEEFDSVNLLIKSLRQYIEKMGGKFETYDIDCSSKYLYISLILLMIFLL